MNAVKCRKVVAASLTVALVSLAALTACGTLEVGVERTPTPNHAATATVSALATENARLATQVATLVVPTSTPMPSLGKLTYVQGGDVWIKALPDGEPQRLTTDGRNSAPRWSPSGEWLAFHKEHQVWVIRTSGTDAHPLDNGTAVNDARWSPVEDRIAYVTGVGSLHLVNADSSGEKEVVPQRFGAPRSGVGRIAWSPDGTWIAYEWTEAEPEKPPSYQGLRRIEADGGEPVEIYANPNPLATQSLLAGWSADEQHILFWRGLEMSASLMADGLPLMAIPTGGGEPVELADAMLVYDDFIVPAPQGDKIAVTVGGGRESWTHKRIALVEAGDGELTYLTEEDLAAFSPSWSPDGQQIAYVAALDIGPVGGGEPAREGVGKRRMWVANADGSNPRQLTNDPKYRDERPLWSADGSYILFARLVDEQASLWLMRADGNEQRQVVDELTPSPGQFGYYGHVDWDQLFDWWRGPVRAPEVVAAPTPGPSPTARPPVSLTLTLPPPTPTPRPPVSLTLTPPPPTPRPPVSLTPTPPPPTPTPTPGPTPTPEPTSDLRPRSSTYGDVEIRMVANPQDSSKTDVCVENLATGEEVLRVTLSDIHISHYHNSEYHNGNLYIIRRIGYVPEQWDSEEWTDELWGYNADGEGTKLYSAQGLDFRVAPDERHIALRISDLKCTWEKLIFLDSSGNSVREFAADQLIGHPDKEAYAPLPTHLFLLEWSDDSSEFWGHVSAGPMPITFYKIKVDLWQITTYEVSKLNIPCEYDLNVNAGKLVCSDCPQIYDVYGREEFEKSQQQVTLFVYDFSNRSTQTIATAVAKCFNPKWLDDSTIEYNNPDGDDRIVYTMPSLSNLAYIQNGDVWVKTLPDGEPQRLTTDGRNSEPRWSPSGEWLAFRKGDYQVWLMSADGNSARPLNEGAAVDAFAWAPADNRLAYAVSGGLQVISADSATPATLAPDSLPGHGLGQMGRIAWSPDGAWIACEWQEWQPGQPLTYQGLWKVSANGKQLTELYASGVPEKGDAILAGWSPDGHHILFWQGETLSGSMLADGAPLYSLPADGGEPVQLARQLASDARPSPDKVLAHSDFVAPAPASAQVAVTVGAYRATWMNKRVAVVEAGTDAISLLTTEDLAAFSPSWSPDGLHLAYVAMPDEGDLVGGEGARLGMMERRIWVVNVQGEPQLHQLTDDPAYRDERPLWSADGSHLLFARMDAEGRASLWLILVKGGDPHRVVDELTPLPDPASGWFGYYGHVDWDNLFDWWRGAAVQEVSLSPRDQLSAEILDTLAAYQPVTDAQPTVAVLLSNIARWLDTGGEPSDLVRTLNEPSDRTEGAITATELDLTADGRNDVVVRIPIMGLPLLVFLNTKVPIAHFEGYALPPDFETIQTDWPVASTAYEIEQPALQLTDLTGDDVPEVLFNSVSVGGSNFRLRPKIFQWHEGDFRLIFAAELVSWVGYSTLSLEANPVGGQDIVLHYPHLYYPTGFEAKMIAHPWATQRWRWDPTRGQYTLHETMRDLDFESNLPDHEWEEDLWRQLDEWEWMRVLVNEAELHYQAGSLEKALASYQSVLSYGASMKRPEGRTVHWPAYARFRIAQVQALLGQANTAQTELNGLLADLDEESNLRPLVQAFDQTYDPAQLDAALRAMAALHGLRLYEQFYWHDDRPGDLTIPMNMLTLLWPGTPLARYLDAHPEAAEGLPSSEREQALLHNLSELGFPVTGVRITNLNADGLNEVLVTTDETNQTNGRLFVWLLAQASGRWHSYRWPNTDYSLIEEVTEKPLPDGRIVLQWRDPAWEEKLAFVWTGDTLVEVDPETYEPLPPGWPVVGWPDS